MMNLAGCGPGKEVIHGFTYTPGKDGDIIRAGVDSTTKRSANGLNKYPEFLGAGNFPIVILPTN